jgi:hypothetical protein
MWQKSRCFLFAFIFPIPLSAMINSSVDSLAESGRCITPVTVEEHTLREQIETTYSRVLDENRFVDYLDQSTLIEFPIGIKTVAGVYEHVILIDSIVMMPQASYVYASMVFRTPYGDLHLIGADIRISRSGGLTGDGKLMLVGDYEFPISDHITLKIHGKHNNTFVEFDCNGYKQFSLNASLMFSDELLVPQDRKLKNVTADFLIKAVDWDEVLVQANMKPFSVQSMPDLLFSVSDAVIDLSDVKNVATMRTPPSHPVSGERWQGVYIREAIVLLSPQFLSDERKGRPPSFGVSNLFIDSEGFSGLVEGNKLLTLTNGHVGSWNFSIDEFLLRFEASRITEGRMQGKILVPLLSQDSSETSREKDAFRYTAVIREKNEYTFHVITPDTVLFPLWKANVKLHPSSVVEVKLEEGKFVPKARLSGTINFRLGLSGETDSDRSGNIHIANIQFQDLVVQSREPFISVGAFSLDRGVSNSQVAGYPVQINEIGCRSSKEEIVLFVDLSLMLSSEVSGALASNGRLSIVSRRLGGRSDSYHFKEIRLDRFRVRVDRGAFKLDGSLAFYRNDPVYGNGISGLLDATFSPGLKMKATATFGNKSGQRYWYADALVSSRTGMALLPPLSLYSFGGGVYYNMRVDAKPQGSLPGKTRSGISYVPDFNEEFGFNAVTTFGIHPGQKTFQGEAVYSMEFSRSGGVRHAGFRGNGYLLADPLTVEVERIKATAAKLGSAIKTQDGSAATAMAVFGSPQSKGAPMSAAADLSYDFDNRILHGNFEVIVNIGKGIIKGTGPEHRAGTAVLHVAPSEWFIYVGAPDEQSRIGLDVGGFAKLQAYLVMGSTVPDSPNIPARFNSILSDVDVGYMDDLNSLADGSGIGFGANFRLHTGDIQFLIFFGKFDAEIGFDVMLKDYGQTLCQGNRLGINGWYANGQAYAFFEGKIGIKVRVLRRTRKIPILELGAAVAVQAKLPNPIWLKGIVGGYFNVLGGLVKGQCRFEIEIGNDCRVRESENSELETLDILAQLTPEDNAEQVDVFTSPQAVFNYELQKEYQFVNDAGSVVPFKISLDEFTLRDSGTIIPAEVKWNSEQTVAALNPIDILPATKNITATVVTTVRERRDGDWVASIVDGNPLQEIRSIHFRTAASPATIPKENVAFAYPSISQLNFYPKEYASGYVQLRQGQEDLFRETDAFKYVVRFTPFAGSPPIAYELTYSSDKREVSFSIPPELLNETIYALEFVMVPKNVDSNPDANVETQSIARASGAGDITTSVRKASGTLRQLQEKIIYQSHFRVSKYNTLNEKLLGLNASSGWRDPLIENVHAIGSNIGGPEPFSKEEIAGNDGGDALVRMEADLVNVGWFQNEIFPLIYSDYPIQGKFQISASNRDPRLLGIVPAKAVFLYQHPHDLTLAPDHISSGKYSYPSTVGRIDYMLAYYMHRDYVDLANQAANYSALYGRTSRMDKLLTTRFPYIKKGEYPVIIRYVLPGKNVVTSSYRHTIFNPVD